MSNNTEEITEEITEEKPIKVKRKVVFTEARLNQLAEARKKAMEKKASMKLITEQTKQIKDNLFKEKMENIKKINEKIPEKVPEKIKKVKKVKKPVTPETSSDESSSSDESEKEIQKSRKKKTYKLSDEYVKKKLYDKMQEDNLKVSWKCLFPNHKLI